MKTAKEQQVTIRPAEDRNFSRTGGLLCRGNLMAVIVWSLETPRSRVETGRWYIFVQDGYSEMPSAILASNFLFISPRLRPPLWAFKDDEWRSRNPRDPVAQMGVSAPSAPDNYTRGRGRASFYHQLVKWAEK